MNKYKFDCGCEIDLCDEAIKDEDGLPSLEIPYYELSHECPLAWHVFYEGRTQGIWQLEKSLGQTWSKEIKPSTIEEVAALGALLRPGCLRSKMDGKSMTKHYADRKNEVEPNVPLHPALGQLLDETYNVLTYQEQSMGIASWLAKFDLQQADTLRKAIGKKKADVMAKSKNEFIEGCKAAGLVNEEDALMIFGAIEKSNRYAFNKSHAVEYAEISYWTAWAKAHFPMHFFCAYLNFAKEKIKPKEEIQLLVDDAKTYNINIYPPKLDTINFSLSKHGIFFGLNNVKGFGESGLNTIFNLVNTVKLYLNKEPKDWTWFEFLTLLASNLTSTLVNNVICVGVLSHTGMTRNQMLKEYKIWSGLTDRERGYVIDKKHTKLIDALKDLLGFVNKNRKVIIEGHISSIENPPTSTDDSLKWIVQTEKHILGVPLTYSKLDTCKMSGGNTTCQEFIDGKAGEVTIAVEIARFSEYVIKSEKNKGKKMGYLTLKDNSNKIEAVIFSDTLEEVENDCWEGNTVLATGYRDKKKDSLVIKRIVSI